jgi:hypothetical protein
MMTNKLAKLMLVAVIGLILVAYGLDSNGAVVEKTKPAEENRQEHIVRDLYYG